MTTLQPTLMLVAKTDINEIINKIELMQSAEKLAKFFKVEIKDLFGIKILLEREDEVKEWNEIANEVFKFKSLSIKERLERLKK